MDERERIRQVMQSVQMNQTRFSRAINVNIATISQFLNKPEKNVKLTLPIYNKILERFPQFNSDWLIKGNGPMTKDSSQPEAYSPPSKPEQIPLQTELYGEENSVEKPPEKPHNKNSDVQTEQKQVVDLTEVNSQLTEILQYVKKEPAMQKSVTKVIVYFSDNTFQELM